MYRAIEREYQQALACLSVELDSGASGEMREFRRVLRRISLRTSARNQFLCTVTRLSEGVVDDEVFLAMEGGAELVAVITREAVEMLELAIGSEVIALVKSSSVLIQTDESLRTSARNQLRGRVKRIQPGPVNTQLTLDIGGGKCVSAVVTAQAARALDLKEGQRAAAIFKASSVILSVID